MTNTASTDKSIYVDIRFRPWNIIDELVHSDVPPIAPFKKPLNDVIVDHTINAIKSSDNEWREVADMAHKHICWKCGGLVTYGDTIADGLSCEECCETESRNPRILCVTDWLEDVSRHLLSDFLKMVSESPGVDWYLTTSTPQVFEERIMRAFRHTPPWNYNHDKSFLVNWIMYDDRPPVNVWLGLTIKNQKDVENAGDFLKCPARNRFLHLPNKTNRIKLPASLADLPVI